MIKLKLPQEFRLSVISKIFYLVVATALVGLSVYGAIEGVFLRNFSTSLVPALLVLIAFLIFRSVTRRKIVIGETSLTFTGLFFTRKIDIATIRGYRLRPKVLTVVPENPKQNVIRIFNYFDFKQSNEIVNWITERFIDLDALNVKNELESFLQDENYGSTQEKRAAKLKLAKEIALFYNIWGGIIGFTFGFFPQQFTFITLLAIPLVGIVLLYTFKLITFLSGEQESIKPHIFYGFIIPSVSLLFKTAQPNFFDYDNMWGPLFGFCILVILLISYHGINKLASSVFQQVIIIIIAGSVYGLGTFKTINCVFDRSGVESVPVIIQDKFTKEGKGTSYYFRLSEWNSSNGKTEEKVFRKMFNQKQVGDTIAIKLKKGMLNVPWYTISSNND